MTICESQLDIALLDENAEIGMKGLHELMDLYLNQADEILEGLRTAIADGSAEQVDHLADKLAGSSAVCGIKGMVAPLKNLEKRGLRRQPGRCRRTVPANHRSDGHVSESSGRVPCGEIIIYSLSRLNTDR